MFNLLAHLMDLANTSQPQLANQPTPLAAALTPPAANNADQMNQTNGLNLSATALANLISLTVASQLQLMQNQPQLLDRLPALPEQPSSAHLNHHHHQQHQNHNQNHHQNQHNHQSHLHLINGFTSHSNPFQAQQDSLASNLFNDNSPNASSLIQALSNTNNNNNNTTLTSNSSPNSDCQLQSITNTRKCLNLATNQTPPSQLPSQQQQTRDAQPNNNNNNNNNNHLNTHLTNANTNSNANSNSSSNQIKANSPTVPSSSLLAKLSAVTSRQSAHIQIKTSAELDEKMLDLLEAFYNINDNPETAAIDMIAKRINATSEAIGDWFDGKRFKTNPNAGPRSPPAKKREGGRVVTFSEYQRSLLEAIFVENNYLHPQEYEELSNLIQVPSRNIKIWFKNRRSKQRLSGRISSPCSANSQHSDIKL